MTATELERAVFRALRKATFVAVAVYIVMQFLGAVTFLMLFFGLVFLLAASLNPLVAWLQRHHVPRPLAAGSLGLLVLASSFAALRLADPAGGAGGLYPRQPGAADRGRPGRGAGTAPPGSGADPGPDPAAPEGVGSRIDGPRTGDGGGCWRGPLPVRRAVRPRVRGA